MQDYVDKKIREALKECGNHAGKARQRIMAQCVSDHKLLLGLVKPHLMGIAAHAVNRIAMKIDKPEMSIRSKEPKIVQKPVNEFGKDLLGAIGSQNVATFGQENVAAPRKHKKVSQRHIDAIHHIAKVRSET